MDNMPKMISVKPRILMHQYERSVILKSRKSRKFWSFAIWMINGFVAKNLDGTLDYYRVAETTANVDMFLCISS